jgi:hypothetical protein
MIQWAWSYLTYGRGARLIAGETPCTVQQVPVSVPAEPAARVTAASS